MITQTDKIIQDRDLYRFMPKYDAPVYGTIGIQKNKLQSFKVTVAEAPPGGSEIVVYAVKTPQYFQGPPRKETNPGTGTTVDIPGQTSIKATAITPKSATVMNVALAAEFKYVYVRARFKDGTETPGSPIGVADNTPHPIIPKP